jgi:putative MFS transporter
MARASVPPGGLGRLDELEKMNSIHRRALVLVALGEFIDGYDLLVVGGALLFLTPQFHLAPAQIGLLGAAAFLGAALGLLVFGDMTDKVGRRVIFIYNLVSFVGLAIVSAFVNNVTQLFIVRFLIGVAVGADIPTSTAFLAELSPRRSRGGLLGALPNIAWSCGAAVAAFVWVPLSHIGPDAWRWAFGLAGIPALFVWLARQTLPESPRWLIKQGQVEVAKQVLARLGLENVDLSAYKPERARFSELFAPAIRSRTLWVSVVFGLNCIAGPIATVATPFILRYVGLVSVYNALLFSGIVWILNLAGAVSSWFLIDRIGRQKLAVLSQVPAGIFASTFRDR